MDAAGVLSCGTPLVPMRVGQVVEERRRADKRVEELSLELARLNGEKLFAEMKSGERQGLYTKHYHRTDDPASALTFLQAITTVATNLATVADVAPHLFVLTSSPSTQTSNSVTTVLVFGSNEVQVKSVGDTLKNRIEVKGGGRGPRWSGKRTGVWKESTSIAVDEILQELKKE